MKKTLIIILVIIHCQLSIVNSFAQSIARNVITSAGGTLTGGSNMITYSIGETVIPTLSGGGGMITQGFEQPGEELHTGTVVDPICAGSTVAVPYNAIDIGAGNTFTVQLSDATGSFASPLNIGTLVGNASGSINANIPANIPAGSGYRIRAVSSYPAITGTDNGTSIIINLCGTFTTLNLKLFLEGFYSNLQTMRANLYDLGISTDPTEADTIRINLWDPAHTNPDLYTEPDQTVLAVLHTDGTSTMHFPSAVTGSSFYIAVKHRNHIETWSKFPKAFTSTTDYDFSTGLDKAYDDGVIAPMKNMGAGVFAFYAGDINQDGGIDGQDMNVIDNEIGFFGYNISDVNGDMGTDGQDMNFVDNNSQLGLFFPRPY